MLIYFCSPFAGPDQIRNVTWARDSCRKIALAGATPFAPHLFFPLFLDDTKPEQRARGIAAGLEIMHATADEVWFYLPPWRSTMSNGMVQEHKAAWDAELTVVIITSHDEWEDNLARLRALLAAP